MDVLGQYLTTLWSLLCQRLQTSATPKYTRYFLIFLALFIDKHGVSTVTTSLDSVQSGLFGMLLQQVLMPNFASVTGDVEHKLCAVALTKILCDCPAILSDKNTWTKLLALLVTYIEGNAGEGAGGTTGSMRSARSRATRPPLRSCTTRSARRRTLCRTCGTCGTFWPPR